VGYGWVDLLRDRGEDYEAIFDEHFPEHRHLISEKWMPLWTDATDPSARVLGAHLRT
jgi:hypothetical protein